MVSEDAGRPGRPGKDATWRYSCWHRSSTAHMLPWHASTDFQQLSLLLDALWLVSGWASPAHWSACLWKMVVVFKEHFPFRKGVGEENVNPSDYPPAYPRPSRNSFTPIESVMWDGTAKLSTSVLAEFPSKRFVRGFRTFAKFAKIAVLLLVLKGVSDAAVNPNFLTSTIETSYPQVLNGQSRVLELCSNCSLATGLGMHHLPSHQPPQCMLSLRTEVKGLI